MNYSDIKSKLLVKRRQISTEEITLKDLYAEKTSVLSDVDVSKDDHLKRVEEVRGQELSKEIEANTAHINDTISKLNRRKKNIAKKQDEAISKLDTKFSDAEEDSGEEDVAKQKADLISKIQGFYGDRFGNIVYNIVEEDVEHNLSMEECWDRFNDIYNQLGIIDRFRDFEFLNNLVISPKVDTSKRENVIMFSISFIIVAMISIMYAFPLFVLFLCALVGVNIYKSYLIIEVVRDCKVLETNINTFLESNRQIRQNKYNDKLTEINKFYNNKLREVDSKLSIQEDLLASKMEETERLFLFNDDELNKEFTIKEEGLKNKIDNLDKSILDKEKHIGDLKLEEMKLLQALEVSRNNLATDFYPEAPCANKFLPSDLLIEISPEPVLFKIPSHKACMFLYSDEEVMHKFVQLFLHRNLSYVEPKKLEITLYDKVYMGNKLLALSNTGVFSLCKSDDEIKKNLKEFTSLMTRRLALVREFGNIIEYNKAMIEMKSVIESYSFIVDTCSNPKELLQTEYRQLLINGPSYGYYPMIFLNVNTLKEDSEKEILELADTIPDKFVIKGDKITKASKLFIKSKIIKRGR